MPPATSPEVMQVFFVTRKPGLSRDEMQRYWREVHGPLTVQMENHLGYTAYEQWHTVGAASDPASEAGRSRTPRGIPHEHEFDGMSILWYKDMAAWEAAWLNNGAWSPERAECARLLLEDNRSFVDLARSPGYVMQLRYEGGPLARTHPALLPASVKRRVTVFSLARPQGVSREDFQSRWREDHGPIVEGVMGDFGGVKYQQMHTIKPSRLPQLHVDAGMPCARKIPSPPSPPALPACGEDLTETAEQGVRGDAAHVDRHQRCPTRPRQGLGCGADVDCRRARVP